MLDTLKQELKNQEFAKANQITRQILGSLVSRSSGTLALEDIAKFTWSDLHKIDSYWTEYSNNRFGFSIQKQIWQTKGFESFVTEVNWSVSKYLSSSNDFSLNSPKGQLPYLGAESFWDIPVISTSTHSSVSHSHRPHFHTPHRNHGAEAAGAGALLVAAAPWIAGVAAIGAAGYGIWWLATKEEREQKEREANIRWKKEQEQKQQETEKQVRAKVEAILFRL